MTDAEMAALEAAARAATPGPWTAYDAAAYGTFIKAGSMTGQMVASVQMYVGLPLDTYLANGRHIAAAHPGAVLALIARVREAEQDRDGLAALVDRMNAQDVAARKPKEDG